MKSNRIDQLAPPPPTPPAAPSPWKAWVIRAAFVLAGTGLGASCPFWPPAAQPVCRLISGVVQTTLQAVPPPTSPASAPPEED